MKLLIIVAAGLGFSVSLAAHIAAITGTVIGGKPVVFAYFACAMALFGASILVATVRPVGARPLKHDELLLECPMPLRVFLYAVFTYAFVNFIMLWSGGTKMKHVWSAPMSPDSARAYSGNAMVFYLVSFAVVLSLHRWEKKMPNKAPEPTPAAVTPRATSRASK